MGAWLRRLPRLAASLTVAVLLAGCLTPAPPDGDGPDGPGGQGQGGEGTVAADWDTLLADLPDASFEEFRLYTTAVETALRQAYAEDHHIVVDSEPPPEESDPSLLPFTYSWRRFTQEYPQGANPFDSAAVARVEFKVRPAKGGPPGLASLVSGEEEMGWSTAEDVDATGEAVTRMWEAMSAGFFPVGDSFWQAFATLHEVGLTGHLAGAGGEFLLPGPAGFDTSLWFRADVEEDGCFDYVVVSYAPEGALTSEPEDWATATSALPEPGFLSELDAYAKATVAALRKVWSGQDVMVAQTGAMSPADAAQQWQQETFTWLRFPVAEGDSGYVLETLTVRLTPSGGTSPLATSATITELVAWDPEGYGSPQDFQALVPARDLFLKSYLCVGDDFLEAFDGLELTAGLTQELPGPDGSKVQLTVEEVSQEGAAPRVRYSLTYSGS